MAHDWQLIESAVAGRPHVSMYRRIVHGLITYRAFDRKTIEPLRKRGAFIEAGSYAACVAQLFNQVGA